MFKLDPAPTFEATVRLSVPGSDAGVPVKITFRHKRTRELDAWLKGAADRPNDAAYLAEVIAGWSGIGDSEGQPVPFSTKALEQLLDAYPSASVELLLAYRRQLADARAKN